MNEDLVQRYNSVVQHGDTVYHLGDVSIDTKNKNLLKQRKLQLQELLPRLNGTKVLVAGNHDEQYLSTYKKLFKKVVPYLELKVTKNLQFVLFHYPIESWSGRNAGSLHLHGHSHGGCKSSPGRLDVGVDCCNYTPLSLEQVLVLLKKEKKLEGFSN